MKTCISNQFYLGCDPEMFFTKHGHIVGSEKIVKRQIKGVIRDGIQVEINPDPIFCRTELMDNIRGCFLHMKSLMKATKTKITENVTVKVSKRHYDTLSDDSKKFGCAPSFNAHTKRACLTSLDPETYLYRSAGGHIHLGYTNAIQKVKDVLNNPERTVPILDIVLGNTCVLLDRDEGNIERRKYYGQAGEYRTPVHGLEYRTLSNFWLKGTPLMSLVFGLARHAVLLTATGLDKDLKKLVDIKDVIRAINTNNKKLAQANFNKIKQFLIDSTGLSTSFFPINKSNLNEFQLLVDDGIDKHFKKDVVTVWTDEMYFEGFVNFTNRIKREHG